MSYILHALNNYRKRNKVKALSMILFTSLNEQFPIKINQRKKEVKKVETLRVL